MFGGGGQGFAGSQGGGFGSQGATTSTMSVIHLLMCVCDVHFVEEIRVLFLLGDK